MWYISVSTTYTTGGIMNAARAGRSAAGLAIRRTGAQQLLAVCRCVIRYPQQFALWKCNISSAVRADSRSQLPAALFKQAEVGVRHLVAPLRSGRADQAGACSTLPHHQNGLTLMSSCRHYAVHLSRVSNFLSTTLCMLTTAV